MRAALYGMVVLMLVGAGGGVPGMEAGAATGLAFLKNGVDARAVMLGQAVTSRVEDAAACYWNPAGLPRGSGAQLLLAHVESFADLRHEYVAVTQPLRVATFGFAFNGIWTDNIESYDAAGNELADFGYSAYEASFAVGREVFAGLTAGGAWKYLREDIGDYEATGWAVDVGLQWMPATAGPFALGLSVRNLGPAMSFLQEEFELPLTVQGGLSWSTRPAGTQSELLLSTEIRHVRDEGTALLAGAEYGYRGLLSFGVGYLGGEDVRDVTVGLGAHRGRLHLHWAYVPIAEDLGDEHRLALRVDL